ncbi:MAG: protein-export chaperone SecB [Chromatiales bacterium]|nr:protein-export chaperone SecB [Chromatiales bacterium]
MAEEQSNNMSNGHSAGAQRAFAIRRIYTKDVSFESPNAPAIFGEEKWNPEVSMSLHNQVAALGGDIYEVVIAITITAKLGERNAYLVEVQQAGEFQAVGFPEDELRELLGVYCPGILYPYLREAISNLVAKGGFPPLMLAPVNFEALYQQHQQQQAQQQARPRADA